jgi:hypothetical protein
VGEEVSLERVYGKASTLRQWLFVVGGGLAVVMVALVTWLLVRRKPPVVASDVPTDLNGFVVAALLREVRAKPSLSLDQRAALDRDLAAVEEYYFAADRNGHPQPDLRRMVERWSVA